jgi:hypothetical protein
LRSAVAYPERSLAAPPGDSPVADDVVTLRADLREPEQVLGDPQVRDLLDFGQLVGIMFMCVLHCLWDKEDPWGVVRQFRDGVVPGSYLALSHITDEAHPEAPPEDDAGAAWHLCGVAVKDQPAG